MKGNRKTNSGPERRLRLELFRMGFRYRKNCPVRSSIGLIRPDIVFVRRKVAVFVDGCFWHSCPIHGNVPRANTHYWQSKLLRNTERDLAVSTALVADGWQVLRILGAHIDE